MSALGTMGLIFIVLKLCGLISWSWWWVISPYLAMPVLVLFAAFILSVIHRRHI